VHRNTQICEVEFRLKILPSRSHDVDIRRIKLRATESSSRAVFVLFRHEAMVLFTWPSPEVYLVLMVDCEFEPEVQLAKINRTYFRSSSTDLRK